MFTKANAPITIFGDANGLVYVSDKLTYNNDGVAITNEFQTPDFVLPDRPEYLNQFMRVNLLAFEAYGQSVTCEWSDDSGVTWNPTQGSSENTVAIVGTATYYEQFFEATVRKIRFRFKNITLSSTFNLIYYGFNWMLRSGRR